jgi:hypothetical protein
VGDVPKSILMFKWRKRKLWINGKK